MKNPYASTPSAIRAQWAFRCIAACFLAAAFALSLTFGSSAHAATNICGYAYLEQRADSYDPEVDEYEYDLVIQAEEPQGGGFLYLGPVYTSGYSEENPTPWRSSDHRSDIVSVSVKGAINPVSMASWFYECTYLESANLRGVSGASLTDMSGLFSECEMLQDIDFTGVDTSHVTTMSRLFDGCGSLEDLSLTSFNTSKTTNMSGMFNGCFSLCAVDLSSFDTSRVTDMSSMFSGCGSLTALDLSRFETSNVTSMADLLWGCSGITSLDLSSFRTSNLKDMSGMFCECSALAAVNVSSFDVSKVEEANDVFWECTSLQSIDLSSFCFSAFVEEPILNNSYDFLGGCTALKAVTIGPRFGDFTILDDLFEGGVTWSCASDAAAPIPEDGFSMLLYVEEKGFPQTYVSSRPTDGIAAIALSDGNTLAIRTGLRELVPGERLVGMATLGVEPWEGMRFSKVVFENRVQPAYVYRWFSSIESLEEVSGLGNVDASVSGDLMSMFEGCTSLKKLDISALDTSGVTEMKAMFAGCSSLCSLDLSNFDTGSVVSMSSLLAYCTALEEVDLSSFDTSRVTGMDYMFENCSSLKELDLSSFNTSRVTDMSNMFLYCSSLKELDLSSFDTSRVTDMSDMFELCESLKRLDVSGFDFENVTTIDDAFRNCSELEYLNLGNIDFESIDSTEDVFYGTYSLKTVEVGPKARFKADTFPDGMWRSSADGEIYRSDQVPSGVAATYQRVSTDTTSYALLNSVGELSIYSTRPSVASGEYLFRFSDNGFISADEVPWREHREDILSVKVVDSIKVWNVAYWFEGCSSLVSADLSKLSWEDIGNASQLFDGCTSLSNVVLPSRFAPGAVSAMFRGCSSLASIDLSGLDASHVGNFSEMFRGCSSLTELDLSGFDMRRATAMKRMFHGCRSLQRVKLGPNFTFRGDTYSRLPGSEFPDGAWRPEGSDGPAYASDSLPSFMSATYVKVDAATPGLTVQSLRGDTVDGKAKYTVTTTLVDGADGLEAVSDYALDPAYASDTFSVGESATASSTVSLTSRTVTRTAVGKVTAPSRVTCIIIGSQVRSIKARAFANSPRVTQLTVQSSHLTKKASVKGCLIGSNVGKLRLQIPMKSAQKVANAFRKWSRA